MRSNKRYTTQTFTKRVDHEGGLHRSVEKPAEPTFCTDCSAIYSDGHWIAKEAATEGRKHEHWRPANPTKCPACRQIENHMVGGYLSIGGDFLNSHRSDIEHLIDAEAKRAYEDNPLSRIMNRIANDDEVAIETTTEHLAQRLGHALKKAFHGDVSYNFSDENKMVRVKWYRDH